MTRTQWEKTKALSASRRLYKQGQRVFFFSADLFADVCPSHRKDAFWLGVARKNSTPRVDLFYADDLSDAIMSYEIPVQDLARLEIQSAPREHPPFRKQGKWKQLVYFIQGVDGGPIKIGYTTNLGSRLFALQANSPVLLRTISCLPGTLQDERAFHNAFRHCHSHLEWFHPDELLVSFSKALRLPYPHLADRSVGNDLLKLEE